MSKIKSFRGLIAHDAIETIALHTNTGSTGYNIVKFELMPQTPMTVESENVVKIFSIPQEATSGTIDFSDNTLLASGFLEGQQAGAYNTQSIVVFDNATFNQDIFITNNSEQGVAVNYYIELEPVKLALDENTVATLKDIRNIIRDE